MVEDHIKISERSEEGGSDFNYILTPVQGDKSGVTLAGSLPHCIEVEPTGGVLHNKGNVHVCLTSVQSQVRSIGSLPHCVVTSTGRNCLLVLPEWVD